MGKNFAPVGPLQLQRTAPQLQARASGQEQSADKITANPFQEHRQRRKVQERAETEATRTIAARGLK